MFLSIVFPALTALGIIPLLRWVGMGEKKDILASSAVGLACMIAVVCAFGRVGEPFQFGMKAMVYGLGFITITGLMLTLWIGHRLVRYILLGVCLLIWVWILTGMAMDMAMLQRVSVVALVLLGLSFLYVYKTYGELARDGARSHTFVAHLVISVALCGFAFASGDQIGGYFAISLCVIVLSLMVWQIPRFGFNMAENAMLPLTLSLGALSWDMWLQGHLPLLSILFMSMVLFSRPAVEKTLENRPQWLARAYWGIWMGVSLLPIGLSIVFFDVLRGL